MSELVAVEQMVRSAPDDVIAADDAERVAEFGRVLAQVALGLEDMAAANADSIGRLSMIRQLLRSMLRDLRAAEDTIEAMQLAVMDRPVIDIDHVGRIERKGSRGRPVWERDQLRAVIVDALSEPGEIGDIADLLVHLLSATPRITAVRERLGRDFDDYQVEHVPGRTRVVMPPLPKGTR